VSHTFYTYFDVESYLQHGIKIHIRAVYKRLVLLNCILYVFSVPTTYNPTKRRYRLYGLMIASSEVVSWWIAHWGQDQQLLVWISVHYVMVLPHWMILGQELIDGFAAELLRSYLLLPSIGGTTWLTHRVIFLWGTSWTTPVDPTPSSVRHPTGRLGTKSLF